LYKIPCEIGWGKYNDYEKQINANLMIDSLFLTYIAENRLRCIIFIIMNLLTFGFGTS
jgi:hypothetical protein